MSRVLVTGASGMLGRAVAGLLVADGHDVRTLQRSPSLVAGAQDVAGDTELHLQAVGAVWCVEREV